MHAHANKTQMQIKNRIQTRLKDVTLALHKKTLEHNLNGII
jgi:hypothetical protein